MSTTQDYRISHAARGATYDDTIAVTPFDSYMAEWERQHLVRLVGELYPGRVRRYLDFACGTGRITSTVAPLCDVAVGVDISPSMLEVARRKLPSTEFRLGDLTTSDIDLGGSFDLVTSFRFFGNAQPELRESALAAIVRRMRAGAHLIINSHRNPRALYALLGRLTGTPDHGMDLHMGKVRNMLARHGLRVVREQPIGAWLYRARMLETCRADSPQALANERRFGHPRWSALAPDVVVVAQLS